MQRVIQIAKLFELCSLIGSPPNIHQTLPATPQIQSRMTGTKFEHNPPDSTAQTSYNHSMRPTEFSVLKSLKQSVHPDLTGIAHW